ncbi:MAG: response regulator [Verrucomicrobiota bacterium]
MTSSLAGSRKSLLLIVDDNLINIRFAELALANHGFLTATMTDGEQVVVWAEKNQPELILLDIMMPGIDGIEVCRALKANPITEPIPVIFLTAKAGNENLLEGFKAGGADYVVKPFEINELLSRIHAHVRIRRLQKDLEEKNHHLEESLNQIAKLKNAMVKICAWTKQIKVDDHWIDVDEYLSRYLGLQLTHGISESGVKLLEKELQDTSEG